MAELDKAVSINPLEIIDEGVKSGEINCETLSRIPFTADPN